MIRKTDKYLLLFLMMTVLSLTLNAERLTLNAKRLTHPIPSVNCQLSTINGQQPTANRQLHQDSLPKLKPDTLSSGVVIIPPTQGRLFVVGDIYISGNKVTRYFVITRELPFKSGDSLTLQQLTYDFTRSREHLINTRLFNEVTISLKGFRGFIADIEITVKERWYIFPLPYVRPVDRNFTAWAETGYSLSRFDYGIKYSQYNFTGRNDNLRLWLITGFSRQVELAYDRPNTGKNLVHGFGGGFLISGSEQLDVTTTNNQQVFVDRDSIKNA